MSGYVVAPGAMIGHVHLKVADLQRSLDFYCRVLGFELTQKLGSRAAFVSAGGYHHHIGLNTWESEGGRPSDIGHTGLYHFAIQYPDRKSWAAAVMRIVEEGIELEGAADHGVSEAVYLRDWDGNGVELTVDKDRDNWPRDSNGDLAMTTLPLNLEEVLRFAKGQP